MGDQTPQNQIPQNHEPELENTTTSIAAAPSAADETPSAPAPTVAPATDPVSPEPGMSAKSKRGLVLAGSIVAAVLVLGGTFGGGVLVGTSVSSNRGITDARQGPGGVGFRGGPGSHEGTSPHGGPHGGPQGGTGSQGGPGSQGSTTGGSTDGGSGSGPGNGPRGGADGSPDSTNG